MAIRTTKTTTRPTAKAKVNTKKTAVVTPKNKTAKDYEIFDRANLNRLGSLYHGTGKYGTKAQQDSSIASISKYNIKAPGRFTITKSSYFPGNESLAKAAKKSKVDYVPPKDTNSGPLRNKPQTKTSQEELYKRYR